MRRAPALAALALAGAALGPAAAALGPAAAADKLLWLIRAMRRLRRTGIELKDEQPYRDLAAILTKLERGDVLFIDEIHRLHPKLEEYLYPAMEDYKLDIIIDQGPSARSIQLPLPRFTLVGATTRSG